MTLKKVNITLSGTNFEKIYSLAFDNFLPPVGGYGHLSSVGSVIPHLTMHF